MKLVDAPGSQDMIDAIRHPLVHKIVAIMLSQIRNRTFFESVALFLKKYEERTASDFAKKLAALRRYGQFRPKAEGDFVSPSYVGELVRFVGVV